ncbi:MAG: oligosaccharide flippase family protein [Steroidobacteraceae bacterium]
MTGRRVAIWTTISSLIAATFQLGLMMVAARHMQLADFGLLAVVNSVAAVILGLQELGLSSYCIHVGEQTHRQHATLFWVSTGLAGCAALLLCALALPLSIFFRVPSLPPYFYWLSLNLLLVGASAQLQANFIRIMKADVVAKIEMAARLLSFSFSSALMFAGVGGVVAIVAGMLLFSLFKLCVLLYVAEPHWLPMWVFEKELARKALSYGAYQGGAQLINQLRTRLDVMIVSRMLGQEIVGLYSLARDLLDYPMRIFQPLMGRLLLPKLAVAQRDPVALEKLYVGGLRLTAWMAVAVYALVGVFAVWEVEIIYGAKFTAVAGVLPGLLVYAVLRPLGNNAGMLAQATGRTSVEFMWNLIGALIMTAGLVLVGWLSPNVYGFAIGLSVIQTFIMLAVFPCFVRPLIKIGFASYVATWIFPLLATLLVALVCRHIHLPLLSELIGKIHALRTGP